MQHHHLQDGSFFHLQDQRNPHVDASDSNETRHEGQSQQLRASYSGPFTPNPNEIGPLAMQHQHSRYGSFFHLQQQRHPLVNESDSNETQLEDQSNQPHASYYSSFTPNPNEIGLRAMQHQHPPYYTFLLLQQQQPLQVNASINNQIIHPDQNRQPRPGYRSTFTPNPNEIVPFAMQHQHSPYDLFPYHPQQQPPYVNPPDNHNEIRPKHNPDHEPNAG
jgi:hypothetical protein